MTNTRTETDSFGPIEVPADCYWGAQTQRSLGNFPFGERADAVVIVTDHSAYDWAFVVGHARLVIDNRNAARDVARHRDRIVRA